MPDEPQPKPEPVNPFFGMADVSTFEHPSLRLLGYPFQHRVMDWVYNAFGLKITADIEERNHRFLEEALELVQSCGCTKAAAHSLVEYVFSRPTGDKKQEVGGVMLTLAALCSVHSIHMDLAGEDELKRVWHKIAEIRAKQAAKPKNSPLPQ